MAASWPFWFPRPVGSSSVGGSGSAALCVWRFIDVEREREDVPLFRVFMSGKSWRHLSFETLPENGNRAYRTKVRRTDVASGVIKAKQPIRNAPLYNVFFLLHLTYIYCIYIYSFRLLLFYEENWNAVHLFSAGDSLSPRRCEEFLSFYFHTFFFCFAGPSPGQAKEMRDLFADRHLEHLFSLSAILFFFLFLLAARSLLLFHCAPIAGHGESRTCVKRSPDFCNGTRSSREWSKSADAENEISSTAMEIELDRIRHTIESSHFHST